MKESYRCMPRYARKRQTHKAKKEDRELKYQRKHKQLLEIDSPKQQKEKLLKHHNIDKIRFLTHETEQHQQDHLSQNQGFIKISKLPTKLEIQEQFLKSYYSSQNKNKGLTSLDSVRKEVGTQHEYIRPAPVNTSGKHSPKKL